MVVLNFQSGPSKNKGKVTVIGIDKVPVLLLSLVLESLAGGAAPESIILFEILGEIGEAFNIISLLSFFKRLSYKIKEKKMMSKTSAIYVLFQI